jgi:hypothetical protein
LRAARLSAGLNRAQLADQASLEETSIECWEQGSRPLAKVPAHQLGLLKAALRSAGAQARLVANLDPAMWGDVVLAALANGEDVTCLPADPLATEPGFADFLGWACAGKIPARYRRFAHAAASATCARPPGWRCLNIGSSGRIEERNARPQHGGQHPDPGRPAAGGNLGPFGPAGGPGYRLGAWWRRYPR